MLVNKEGHDYNIMAQSTYENKMYLLSKTYRTNKPHNQKHLNINRTDTDIKNIGVGALLSLFYLYGYDIKKLK